MNKILLLSLIVTGSFGIFSASSCKKTEPCEAVITVKDTLGKPLAGATVSIHPDSATLANLGSDQDYLSDVVQEAVTSSSGEVFFTVQREAVLDVDVIYLTQTAQDYIRLQEGETARLTVIVE